ncbi:ABC transporter ATP-binding protein [Roseateles terrae]|uniref:Peptide/nickel transport system ATP-binding protein n=1 Tax=Roseateles terrae TaxID=431060 RepID=A0ABR6GRM2_9BURK|nr:dipeptide ABC transporter ATP-binding protein [Roseateles terrae]MBB3193859.1 peptide/nickel transport system ATP-binding protein [Roseateles terrae]OWQ90074.1 ABC transporter ATP-binding protein [Roseateles terrae]
MLKIEDIKVHLDAEAGLVRAIDGMRLTLSRGQTFALVGESGCGKSMTALALMRLLPDNGRIADGRLDLDGQDLFDLSEARMRDVRGGRIGMIFQEPGTSLNPVMKVGDQIVEAIEAHTALRGAAARAKAVDWLRRVGIPEPERRIDDYPFRMSGGQKQRVMIAMTLAAEPDYLIADEPTTALDVTIQAQILDLLKDLQRERGLGLLLITHDLGVVSGMAHQVALMYAGQIVEVAPAQDFFAAPRHPYARLLLKALPDADRRGEPLAAIPGTVPPLWQDFDGCRFAPRCDRVMVHCGSTCPSLSAVPDRPLGHEVRCLLYTDPREALPRAALPMADASAEPAASAAASATATRPLLLEVKDLKVRYPLSRGLLGGSKKWFDAVGGVSWSIEAGRTLALVGESGCGKTTTGKAIVQLLRRVATIEGQAWLHPAVDRSKAGQGAAPQDLFALDGEALRDARRQVQIIFQDPFASLNPRLRVQEVLEEGLLALRPELDAGARQALLHDLVDQVGLRRDALGRFPHEFSGGQRQRIAIARALAVQPRLIVCDEPTSALDVSVQAQILNLLRELQRQRGLSFLFITHNIGVVEYIADNVAVMQAGRIVEAGNCSQVLGSPQQAYTRTLLAAVPRVVQRPAAA